MLGHLIDGTQAEFVRVPFADTSLYPLPDSVADEDALMFADILPTAYEVGVLNGRVTPGDTVVVVGAGPIGLAAITTARLFSPAQIIAVDVAPARLEAAKQFGADTVISAPPEQAVEMIRQQTDGLGADVAIEAVGIPETFELCTASSGQAAEWRTSACTAVPPPCTWSRCGSRTSPSRPGWWTPPRTPTLLRMLASGQLSTHRFLTHRFGLDEMLDAYQTFSAASGDVGAEGRSDQNLKHDPTGFVGASMSRPSTRSARQHSATEAIERPNRIVVGVDGSPSPSPQPVTPPRLRRCAADS